jgi:hypothetical protein
MAVSLFLVPLMLSFLDTPNCSFSDISPTTIPGQIFAIFYIIIGLGFVATSIGSLASVIAEWQTERLVAEEKKEIASIKRMQRVMSNHNMGGKRPRRERLKNLIKDDSRMKMMKAVGLLLANVIIGAVFIYWAEVSAPPPRQTKTLKIDWCQLPFNRTLLSSLPFTGLWSRCHLSAMAMWL